MDQDLTPYDAFAALDFQIGLGVDEAIGEAPVDRYAQSREQEDRKRAAAEARHNDPFPLKKTPPAPVIAPKVDPVAEARALAESAGSLEDLRDAMAGFEHCDLKKGARSLVFSDGNPNARVMIIGEAPGRDEDIQGRPFVGRAGQLLDRMLAAIDLSREATDAGKWVYITNVLPWRPPQNRDPKPEEIAMLKPFVERHVSLVQPDLLVLMGNISCQAGLGRRGITRLRGNWTEAYGLPALPMFHPAYLLRNPSAKREAWADLLDLQSRLRNDRAAG
ncbi:DNA polymerase [Aliiruegeria haliotis]|uniref:Type-4 uracil-DNA glycosylase n=1 Tax=Aliiruegeria haliotis TaxID=1280846 RepID=A0A2T0RT25_9RHOB|nr:uracil-DNA glycosylase [Aliiruegeria haliotis]PRY24334.1 DNA polymerase [Aliiruegeria haliotis]